MNINESVTIKLNENGMDILRAEHADLKSAFPSMHDFVEIDADEDGLYPKKMQLWSVMQTFGPHISLGANPPISTEIEIPDSDELNKLKEMNKELLAALEGVMSIVDESNGISGYHMNGDIADWGEFEEVGLAYDAIAKAKAAA